MTKEDYMNNLIRQFRKAKGLETVDINNEKFQKEFSEYISELYSHKDDYIRLLHSLGVYTNDEKTVEVGKGPLDSVVLDTKATIVTNFPNVLDLRDGKTYQGVHTIHKGDIYMLRIADTGIEYESLDIGNGRVYMTHNMYHKSETGEWYQLVRDNDVLIGAYGKESDLDKDKKIRKIIDRFDAIGDSYCNYGTVDGYYFYAQKSRHKKLVKEKVRYKELEYGRVR